MIQKTAIRDGGVLLFCPRLLNEAEADALFATLRRSVPWRQEAGRGRPFPRLTAWYADAGLTYSYSGVTHHSLPWLPELLGVKDKIEQAAEARFNSLLLNLYRNGNDSIGMHADDEPELGANPVIGSVSLGAVRQFVLKHRKSREKIVLELPHGSLLVMAGTSQQYWLHGVPKTARPVGERINLTFRRILRADNAS
jgi:alkylated DNA repair dioxygenase AlkB